MLQSDIEGPGIAGCAELKERTQARYMYVHDRCRQMLLSVTQEGDNGRASWQRHRLSGIGQLTTPTRYKYIHSCQLQCHSTRPDSSM